MLNDYIIHIDSCRAFYKTLYEQWRYIQKSTTDRDFAFYCRDEANDCYDKYLKYRRILSCLGVCSGDNYGNIAFQDIMEGVICHAKDVKEEGRN